VLAWPTASSTPKTSSIAERAKSQVKGLLTLAVEGAARTRRRGGIA
jgi:hypothetical protein